MGTSNFRRLMSCWINWYPVDPSQLVPSLLPLLLGNLILRKFVLKISSLEAAGKVDSISVGKSESPLCLVY